ncbi:MAG: hypothetical protein HY297_03655 [Thaumarchaeota archaeon]|nr:hypothetical protein [Nitrososphaerota archaeon]
MKCLLCSRDAVSELCRYHLQGKESLETAYPHWVKAYGILGWKDYLDRVKRNVQTGQWAKETAEMLAGR